MEQFLVQYTVSDFHNDLKKIIAEVLHESKGETEKQISPKYGTRREVSEKLHLSYPTLNRFNKEGILKAQKIGGRVLYLWSEVEKALDPTQPLKHRRSSRV